MPQSAGDWVEALLQPDEILVWSRRKSRRRLENKYVTEREVLCEGYKDLTAVFSRRWQMALGKYSREHAEWLDRQKSRNLKAWLNQPDEGAAGDEPPLKGDEATGKEAATDEMEEAADDSESPDESRRKGSRRRLGVVRRRRRAVRGGRIRG